jgi:hypothetical protein
MTHVLNNSNIIQLCGDNIDQINTNCYLCLEQINYYYKFDCGCHNYFHTDCVKDNFFEKCLICKKKINLVNNILNINNEIFDLYYTNLFLPKIKKILDIFFIFVKLYPNIFTFGLYILINIILIFVFVVPFIIFNIIYNISKKYYLEFFGFCFLLLIVSIPNFY